MVFLAACEQIPSTEVMLFLYHGYLRTAWLAPKQSKAVKAAKSAKADS
jgi:hypothetical protein